MFDKNKDILYNKNLQMKVPDFNLACKTACKHA